jgi:hypothetical protein
MASTFCSNEQIPSIDRSSDRSDDRSSGILDDKTIWYRDKNGRPMMFDFEFIRSVMNMMNRPVVDCNKIVEVYMTTHSYDEIDQNIINKSHVKCAEIMKLYMAKYITFDRETVLPSDSGFMGPDPLIQDAEFTRYMIKCWNLPYNHYAAHIKAEMLNHSYDDAKQNIFDFTCSTHRNKLLGTGFIFSVAVVLLSLLKN